MVEKIVFEVETKTGNSAASVKSVKAELRALQNEMAGLDIGSDAFVKAAQKAAMLKDKIEDASAGVKAFNPEAKFQAFAGVLGGVANGFSAAQGAMAIFGSESKDLEKLMVQTQGAIALATGINGLMGMGDAFTNLGNVIKVNVVGAFTTLKGAMMATGIGALIVAIGVAIHEIGKYNEAIDEEAKSQEKLNEELKKSKDLMEGVASASEKRRNSRKGGLDDLNRELKLLEAQGASEQKLFEKRQQITNVELLNLKTRKYSGLDVSKEIADKENELLINQAALDKKIRDKKEEEDKKAEEKRKERLKANKKSNDEYAKLADERFKADMYSQIDAQKELAKMTEEFSRKEFEDSMKRYDQEKAATKFQMELDKAKTEARLANLTAVSNALRGLGQLIGEETAAGKSLAVAQATIDTYVGATKAYAQGGVLGFVTAAAVIAAGLANVRKIVSTKIPGQSSGGGGGSFSAPQAPQFNPALATQVQGAGDVTLGPKPVPQKVYVVESDIRGVQNKVAVIDRNATIG
jgi:hypothetical protein